MLGTRDHVLAVSVHLEQLSVNPGGLQGVYGLLVALTSMFDNLIVGIQQVEHAELREVVREPGFPACHLISRHFEGTLNDFIDNI